MSDRVTREGAGAEERALALAVYIDNGDNQPYCIGCDTALPAEADTHGTDCVVLAAVIAASAAATAKERERLHALLESIHAAIDPMDLPAVTLDALEAELHSCGDEQDGAPQ